MRKLSSLFRGLAGPVILSLFLALSGVAASASASDGIPTIFLHGTSGIPSALFLDTVAPTATAAKLKDSAGVTFGGGNPWREIGTWTAGSALFTGTVSSLNPLHAFVGLKNSDDEGTRFDARAEAYKNGLPLTSGQTLCLTGVTRNPDKAKEIIVAFDAFPEETFTATDVLSVRVLTRIGTTGAGSFCGGHGSAVGLRLYFDSVSRPSRLAAPLVVAAGLDWNTGVGGNASRTALSLATGPAAPSVLWHGGIPAVFGQQSVVEGDTLVSTRTESFGDDWFIVAQDLSSGSELWRVRLPISFTALGGHVSAIRGGQVYAKRDASGALSPEYLYALKATDGAILWRSQDTLDEENYPESLTFADDGDPIVGNFFSITRINHVNGKTIWTTARQCPISDGCMATVSGGHVYAWDYDYVNSGFVVGVIDAGSGDKLYSSAALPFGVFPTQNELMAGPDGMVYAAIDRRNLGDSPPLAFIALHDTGSALIETWRVPTSYTAFASFGIGPDGSVYTYSPSDQILRLDPATGTVRNTSMPIPTFSDIFYGPRMAIDSAGRVFLTAESPAGGMLYSFNADLTLRWSDSLPEVNLGGPALGRDGTLVVCGAEVRAYKD